MYPPAAYAPPPPAAAAAGGVPWWVWLGLGFVVAKVADFVSVRARAAGTAPLLGACPGRRLRAATAMRRRSRSRAVASAGARLPPW
jgi:hypothetical protein